MDVMLRMDDEIRNVFSISRPAFVCQCFHDEWA